MKLGANRRKTKPPKFHGLWGNPYVFLFSLNSMLRQVHTRMCMPMRVSPACFVILARSTVTERAMDASVVVVVNVAHDRQVRIGKRRKLLTAQALLLQQRTERLDVCDL